MEILKPEYSEPCNKCKNWQRAADVCPNILDWIPDIRGKMCSQGVLNREMCAWNFTTRFEPVKGMTDEELKQILSEDAFDSVKKGLSEKRHREYLLDVSFVRN